MTPTNSKYKSAIKRFCGLLLFLLLPIVSLKAQERCGTVAYNKLIFGEKNALNQQEHFETWLSQKIKQKSNSSLYQQSKSEADIVEIPIIVHIIHTGESIGVGGNIADAQIQSQIDVLNEDFRRLNADKANTPSIFASVAADVQIEFVLAKRDPEGLASSGIVRVANTKSSWSMSDNSQLKALSYWPAEDYLNLWVTEVTDPLLGFAQFPETNVLDGLEDASANVLTDGVVVDYKAFGSIDKYPDADLKTNFNKGRTATHEIGHFLGLRHIWGDSNCGTDYCNDTPTQQSDTNGCPTHPASGGCGTSEKMFQNYMDYTSDQCMNLFTVDQNDRMRTILENSPRRQSLTTSLALLNPFVYNFDLGLFSVLSPNNSTCDATTTPTITVKNYGNVDLNNAQIRLIINDIPIDTINANFGVLTQLSTTTIDFSDVTLQEGDNLFKFEILTINGMSDQGISNNVIEHLVILPEIVPADITEDFQNGIENMSINNIDGNKTWEIIDAPDGTTSNKALYMDYFDYENEGTEDWLLSQTMDFSSIPAAKLTFDYSHSQYPGRSDRLKVLLTSDCGVTYQELFNKSGEDLMTTSSTSASSFTPTVSQDWESVSIDLSTFLGSTSIQVAFVGVNDFGNNIYLDNISLITSNSISVKLKLIDMPTIVSGSEIQPLNITVKNTGGITVNELSISYAIDNESAVLVNKSGLNIESGKSNIINIGEISSTEGLHSITVNISKPNSVSDVDLTDNLLSSSYVIDLSTDVIPLREQFEKEHQWVTASRSDVNWESIPLNGNNSIYVNSAQNTNTNGVAWLVSPILDLSNTESASLFFDLSYAISSNGNSETLNVLLSEDGGLDNYPFALYNKSGSDLSTYNQVQDDWSPESGNTAHWDSVFINLSEYVGEPNIRLAFQLTNGNGNNIYLDNIEFFTSTNSQPVDIGEIEVLHFPNPIFSSTDAWLNLVFNLEERQKAKIRIFDLAGNLVFNQEEPYALNQTFTYDASGLPSGMLILSIIGETFKYNKRIVVIR